MLLAFEVRAQFHGADKTGNKNQTVTTDGTGLDPIVVPFGWQNSWSLKIGFEYRFKKDFIALRLGTNIANSATTGEFAQYFTPPPTAFNFSTGSAGLGFYWNDRNDPSIKDKYQLDLGGPVLLDRQDLWQRVHRHHRTDSWNKPTAGGGALL